MNIKKIVLVVLLCVLILPIISCTGSQTRELSIDRDIAILIATACVPTGIISKASVLTLWDDNKWIVHFSLAGNTTVTRGELGWSESPANSFENQGSLPADTYRLLTINIDRKTGLVLSRRASDSVLLGGPGIFNTEPPEPVFLPLWVVIVSGIGGLVIGGSIVRFVLQRTHPQS
jgi:hypothetical protein